MNREQRIEDKLTLERNLKRFEESLAQKRRVIRPDFKKLYNDKGIFLMSIKNYSGALKCFNTALKLYPNYEETIDNKKKLILILNKKQKLLHYVIDKNFQDHRL
jgi:lipoprotein NlpI